MKLFSLLFLLFVNDQVDACLEEIICGGASEIIDCGPYGKITILTAMYGRKVPELCVTETRSTTCEAATTFDEVSNSCNNMQSCTLFASHTVYGDPCGGIHKYMKVEYKCTYDSDDATRTVHVKIENSTSVVVAWNDTVNDNDFPTFSNVVIDYGSYTDEIILTDSKFLSVPYAEHGKRITGLSPTMFHVFYVIYYNNDCHQIKCYPIYVQTEDNGQIKAGVYDILLKMNPEENWKYDNSYWQKLKDREYLNLEYIHTGFDDKDTISPFAYEQTYENFLIGMKASMGEDMNWVLFLIESVDNATLRNHIRGKNEDEENIGSRIYATKDDFLTLSPTAPAIGDVTYRLGFDKTKGGSEKITMGYIGTYSDEKFALGLGMKEYPYVGLFQKESPERREPMFGYVMGRRSTWFQTGVTYVCQHNGCGLGTDVSNVSCLIPHSSWIDVFCPPVSNKSCAAIEECIFDAPENLRITDTYNDAITLTWDQYNTSALFAPNALTFKINGDSVAGVSKGTQDAGSSTSTSHKFVGLDLFTNYTFQIFGHSTLGDVNGSLSNPVTGTTKQGVPTGKANFISANATSSWCIKVIWEHIPANEVIGYLRSYELQYFKTSDGDGDSQYNETGLVTEYVVCDLLPFSDYTFYIRARNDEELGSNFDEIEGKSGQYIPRKFTNNVNGTDTGSYSVKIFWDELESLQEWRGYPYRYHIYYGILGDSVYNTTSVKADTFEIEIGHLESYTDYEVAVAAATVVDIGLHSEPIVVKTGEDAPISPPLLVNGTFNDSRSIQVVWSEVALEERKGVITKYLLICTTLSSIEKGRQNVSSSEPLTAIFGGLEIYTKYYVTVAAYTKVGLGPASEPVIIRSGADAPFFPPFNLTGYNTSSTSIHITWEDIPVDAWGGIIGAFRLIIQSSKDPGDKNVTNITRDGYTGGLFKYDAKHLNFFTQYSIKVACFNTKGISEFDNITLTTEEEVTTKPPPNVRAYPTKSNQISVFWDPPLSEDVPGIVRTYTIRLQAIYELDDLTIGLSSSPSRKRRDLQCMCCEGQYCEGLNRTTNNITVHGAGTVSVNISGLRGNTYYNVTVAVDTKFLGLASPPYQILTPFGTPSMSAFNFTCEALSHSSLLLQWKHSPPAYLEGIRTQYMIYYQLGNKIVNETLYPYKRKMEIFFLHSNTDYIVWMTAFTKVGEGVRTDKLYCSTSETTPTTAPLNVTASSFHYPYASLIQWNHIPDDQWHGSKMGYTIFYERLSTGEVNAEIPIITNFTDVALTTSHILTGLQLYSVYRIRIAARTNRGVGFQSAAVVFETCHVPLAKLILNYFVYPPYVDEPKKNSLRPGGILMDLTEQMLLSCGRVCSSFNESIHISYNHIDVDYFSDIKNLKFNGTQLQIPRLDTGKFTPDYSHIVTATSPGFILLEVPDSPAEAAAKTEDGLLDGIFATLPLVVLYLVLNWLFGAIFWFCEPTKVEYKGTGMSVRGMFEGLYLAVMTSTTVGYGDKVPETTQGRLYIVFWTLLGLVLTGIVAGNLSSSLSVAAIISMKQNLPDDKVLALYGTSEYTYGEKKIKKFEKNVTYYTYEELLEPLKNQTVKYALLDRYVAEILKSNISDYGLGVNKAFDIPTDFGVAAYGEMEKLKVCGTRFAKANTDIISKEITKLLKELEQSQVKQSDSRNSSTASSLPVSEESVDMISFDAPLYRKTLTIVLLMWLGFIILGIIYELFRRRRLNIFKNKIHTGKELKLLWQKELREFVKETLQEFQELMERMDEKIDKLDYKHGKELLKLRTELSKLYGVNFKFVKPSELGLPLETILEYKNEAKNRPKEPLSVRLRRRHFAITSTFSWLFRFVNGK